MSECFDQSLFKEYQFIRQVGKGAYGVVFEANRRISGERVAIKKCFGCFQNTTDAQRIYREVSALMSMSHPNILRLRDVLIPSTHSLDIYVITEFVPIDLAAVIKHGLLQDVHRLYITYQILKGLDYMHRITLLHRDIKPSNILLDSHCNVRLCDFGLVRLQDSDSFNSNKTDYVATRWYRAPEIILGSKAYSFPVDLWATGTILAEMYSGKQLFPGTSTLNQLERIIELTGFPSDEELVALGGMSSFGLLQNVSNTLHVHSLAEFVPHASHVVLDLLRQMLQFSPSERISASMAMRHGAFAKFHTIDPTPIPEHPYKPKVADSVRLSPMDYRSLLDNEVREWKVHAKVLGDFETRPDVIAPMSIIGS